MNGEQIDQTIHLIQEQLSRSMRDNGTWPGRLSSSAAATATALFALACVDRSRYHAQVDGGLQWLRDHQNADGGWGDTIKSPSRLGTTLMCYSAFAVADSQSYDKTIHRAQDWIKEAVGSLEASALAAAVEQAYGQDKCFCVSLLTHCALAGRLGPPKTAWSHVKPLAFELALLPRWLIGRLGLLMGRCTLPALIAVGQVRFFSKKPRNPASWLIRRLCVRRSLSVLQRVQPDNGGFLEAVPLTSFVVMSLARMGHHQHPLVQKSVQFLTDGVRYDGSWPLASDPDTWMTTLTVNTLTAHAQPVPPVPDVTRDWLLAGQRRTVHPSTGTPPGAWAWNDRPGAVPDAYSTAGALICLHALGAENLRCLEAAAAGVQWLLNLQNKDGGVPAFGRACAGAPFNRSCPDVTAHALAALSCWCSVLPRDLRLHTDRAIHRAFDYLNQAQSPDGYWTPRWFGNELTSDLTNPVCGTSRVLAHLARFSRHYYHTMTERLDRGVAWLTAVQNADGGWGAHPDLPSSIEETALAVAALAGSPNAARCQACLGKGVAWLLEQTECGTTFDVTAIGLYFARFAYYDPHYPIVFTLAALDQARRLAHS